MIMLTYRFMKKLIPLPVKTAVAVLFLLASYTDTLADQSPLFDFGDWKKDRGASKSLKEWQSENPSPHRSYYTESSKSCAQRWYINLGPLGVCTLMHDRSWAVFGGVEEIYPAALTDEQGAALNAFEVTVVKKGSPADGHLQQGDLVVQLDGQWLKGAQHTFLERQVGNKNKRGLEIHAGQLIDRAEARGTIDVTVLRLPDELKNTPQKSGRVWRQLAKFNVLEKTPVSMKLEGGGVIRIRTMGKKEKWGWLRGSCAEE
jgi:hypothetical protein